MTKSKQNDVQMEIKLNSRKSPTNDRRKKISVTSDPPKNVMELALQLKMEEIRVRRKNFLALFITVLTLCAVVSAYVVNRQIRSTAKIEKNYQEISDLINQAYLGNPTAHAKVIEQFPILVRQRLTRSLNSVKVSQKEMSDAPDRGVELYSANKDNTDRLGFLDDDSQIISIDRQGKWSRIMLAKGVPVWVSNSSVSELGNGLLKVHSDGVLLQSRPAKPNTNNFVGLANQGDILQLISKREDWFQVNSHADQRIWVDTDQLDTLLELD